MKELIKKCRDCRAVKKDCGKHDFFPITLCKIIGHKWRYFYNFSPWYLYYKKCDRCDMLIYK